MKTLQYLVLVAAILATTAAAPAFAQSANQPPTRIGNIWDWDAHEPDPATVRSDLRAMGDAPNPQRERVVTDEVEDTYQRLIREEAANGEQTAPPGPEAAGASQPDQPSMR